MLAPVGVIFLGMILVSGRGRRLTTTPLARRLDAPGRRLLVRAGDDLHRWQPGPGRSAAGRSSCRSPTRCRSTRGRASRSPTTSTSRHLPLVVLPEARRRLRRALPADPDHAVAAALYLVFKSRNKIVRVLAAAALVTAVVYLFTPLTAAGQEGEPRGFFTNTRYLLPGLLLALVLLPRSRGRCAHPRNGRRRS